MYSRDFALSKLSIPFAAGAGMGVTVSSMGKMSYQVNLKLCGIVSIVS